MACVSPGDAGFGRLQDRLDLAELCAHMTRLLNDQRIDELLDCYTEDGSFQLVGMAPLIGREPMGAMMRSMPGVIHMTLDVVFAIDGDFASGQSNLIASWARQDRSDSGFLYSGRYRDTFRRVGDAWKIEKRLLALDSSPERIFAIVQEKVGMIDSAAWRASRALE